MAIALTLITLAFGPVVGRNPHSLHDRARGPSIGTDGSNPALSSAESAANLTPGRHGGDAKSEEIVWARRRAESHVKPRRVRTELTESAELEVRIHSPPALSQPRTADWGIASVESCIMMVLCCGGSTSIVIWIFELPLDQ